jgi:shikimate kinase/shikimate kinase/3-dehydroquinate synthase
MKSKENIVFLGMMGSGKTSIGYMISKRLNLDFFDIDQYIEKELGMTIFKIFETKGENFFRNFEEKITLEILKKNSVVISLGGGAFLNSRIRKEILTNHISFWLKWKNETLIKRILNNSKRPLAHKATKNELINLIKKRSNFYSKALYKVNCDNLTKTKLRDKIINIYEKNKTSN